MNIFEALRADHDEQRALLKKLMDTSGDSESRALLFDELKRELSAHAAAEERHFYVPLMELDETQDKARHSVAEHHELEELIEKLEETDRSSSGWMATARKLEERTLHHLEEEEHEVFQMAGKVLSDDQKTALATTYRAEFNNQKAELA